jgi:hypothetical protein
MRTNAISRGLGITSQFAFTQCVSHDLYAQVSDRGELQRF